MYFSIIAISNYRVKNRRMLFLPLFIEENIEISFIEEKIEVGWSNSNSKCYYKGENSNGLEML